MKSYDDLQRFKEKTQTKHIEFKDMSEQTRNADNTNWAIIRQLMGAESDLGNGQRTDIAAPQPAAADLFSQPVATTAPVKSAAKPLAPISGSVAAFVSAKPAAQGASLLESISASLKPGVQPSSSEQNPSWQSVAEPEASRSPDALRPLPVSDRVSSAQPELAASGTSQATTASSGASLLDAVRAQQAPASHTASQPARFKQLFNASAARAADDKVLSKETPLQSLLEKIASCR